MNKKPIVLHDDGLGSQKHDVIQAGDTLDPTFIDITSLRSKLAGNVIRVEDDGKLYVNNLCDGTNPHNPTTPTTEPIPTNPPVTDEPNDPFAPPPFLTKPYNPPPYIPPYFPYPNPPVGSPGTMPGSGGGGAGSSGSTGGGGSGGSGGGSMSGGGGGLGDGYHSGGAGGFGSGGGGGGDGCQAPDNCKTNKVALGYKAFHAGVLGITYHTDDPEPFEQAMARIPDRAGTAPPTIENEDTVTWSSSGYPIVHFGVSTVWSNRTCGDDYVTNTDRKDGLWVLMSGEEEPPSPIFIMLDGCAACMSLVERERVEGSEDQYRNLYAVKIHACALNKQSERDEWTRGSEPIKGVRAPNGTLLNPQNVDLSVFSGVGSS